MKNLLKSTLYLFAFALAGILFQISCSTSDSENRTALLPPASGKIVYENGAGIWKADYDGSNAAQIPIVLPPDVIYNFGSVNSAITVSPDGSTVFFTCSNQTYAYVTTELYACSINGGNATLAIGIPAGTSETQHVGHAVAF